MPFHRLRVPTYNGGLRSGVDYLNNAASGTPALVDSVKSGGPNAGTYFVAQADDATSENTNRPHGALGENTDWLDDLFHRDLAVAMTTAGATVSGSALASIVLSGPGIFLGATGTPNTAAGLKTLFHILDASHNEIVDPTSGAPCVVTAISGGTVGSNGFSTGDVALTVDPALPVGSVYHVVYGARSNLAEMPVDAFTSFKIRTAEDVPSVLIAQTGAALIGYAGGAAWRDGTTNPPATTEAQLDKIVTDLTAVVTSHAGSDRLGSGQIGTSGVGLPPWYLAPGSISSQFTTLLQASNETYAIRTLDSSNYASAPIDASSRDSILLIDPTGVSMTLGAPFFNLPQANLSKGRRLTFIDLRGASTAATHFALAHGYGGKINGSTDNYPLQVPNGRWTAICDGTDWYIVGPTGPKLVAVYGATVTTGVTVPATGAFTTVLTAAIANLQVGDILEASMSAEVFTTVGADIAPEIKWSFGGSDGATYAVVIPGVSGRIPQVMIPTSDVYTATAAGSMNVLLQVANSGAAALTVSNRNWKIHQIRPTG